ncbi:MAG TPA: hypothetical protein VFY91_08775 [Microbacterium sp.]|nr:hypothetical protein [Microbacterium sp.]
MLRLSRFAAAARIALAVLAVATLGATMATPAVADEVDEPPAIRWSVTPADETGPDGRTAVENELDPSETVDDHFAVRNVSDAEVTFQLTAADGFYTRTGRFDILPADQESVDAGTWISLPETVTVPAGAMVVVPFSITVPELAEPGDHAAGITASVLSVQSSEDGTSVGVESRVGFRVTTRVTGELAPKAEVQALTGDYTLSWNPFRPGEMTVTFDVANQGNAILLAEGSVNAGGQTVTFPAVGENPQELLPGDTRTITATVEDVWPLFLVTTGVTLTPTVQTMDGATTAMTPVTAEVVVWAVPWPQLIVLLGIALVILSIAWGRIRSRRKVAALVAEAKEQGRREAASVEDGSTVPVREDVAER